MLVTNFRPREVDASFAAMEEARKLLDSLMGSTRNEDFESQQKQKGRSFTQESVCKHYLLGFCPYEELASSKMIAKRNIGECRKTHSDAMKAEYEAHTDKSKLQVEYEKALLPVLEGLVREADAWVSRERGNVKRTELTTPEKATVNNMPPSVKEQHEQLIQDMNKLMAAAEEIAESGDVDGSKFKVMLAGEIKDKIKELEDKHIVTYTVTYKGEEVCEICGTRYEANHGTNHARYMSHFTGKVHLAYVKIRDWVKKLRAKQREADEVTMMARRQSRSPKGGADRRSKGNDRDKEQEPPRERERERRRERSRSKRGGGVVPEGRRRSRSRGGGGGGAASGGFGGERRRDRSRSRRRGRSRSRG